MILNLLVGKSSKTTSLWLTHSWERHTGLVSHDFKVKGSMVPRQHDNSQTRLPFQISCVFLCIAKCSTGRQAFYLTNSMMKSILLSSPIYRTYKKSCNSKSILNLQCAKFLIVIFISISTLKFISVL